MAFLEFAFRDIFHFAGVVFLLVLVGTFLDTVIRVIVSAIGSKS